MTFDPHVFKAYDVRGLYPDQLDEGLAALIGRGFVAHLGARRIAVSRDMRVSSPALATAFIAGARAQGADVVDIGPDGDRPALLRGGPRRPRRRRPDHRVAQPGGLQRHQARREAGAPAQRRLGNRRDSRHASPPTHCRRRPPAKAAAARHGFWTTISTTCWRSSTRRSSGRSRWCSTPATAWRGWWRRPSSTGCRAARRDSASTSTGRSRTTRRTPLIEANRRDLVEAVRARSADAGNRLGRRRRPLLLRRRRGRVRARRLRHRPARGGLSPARPRAPPSSTTCGPATPSGTPSPPTGGGR